MERVTFLHLKTWLYSPHRKPLIIRGARQVGKTWLVRRLAEMGHKVLIELNFEKKPQLATLFESNEPKQILTNIEAAFNLKIVPQHSILFLDEIQEAPLLLAKLRWFAEEMPELPVVAAGSLLEFVLAEHTFSMPVGRINYFHVEPLSFEEFLLGIGQEQLQQYLLTNPLSNPIPSAIHQQLMAFFKEYLIVGGMPAVVNRWVETKNVGDVSQAQYDLLATYRDDFAKFSGKIAISRLDEVMLSIPKMLGQKFVYSKVNKNTQAQSVKNALQLLLKARLAHQVQSCYANGIPLGAETNEKYFKVIMLDVGLASSLLDIRLNQVQSLQDISFIHQGGLSEQVTGQLLRTLTPFYVEPQLYYWVREEKGSAAEIDYVIQHQNHVIPIEVKSGMTGSLKSLHLLMKLKKLKRAVRINSDLASLAAVNVETHDGTPVNYQLLSIPFYYLGQLHRLLDEAFS